MLSSIRPSFFKNPNSFRHRISLTPIDDEDDVIQEPENQKVVWSPELDQLLRRWKEQVRARQMRHSALSKRYAIVHYAIGLPFTILQAMVATGNFFQAFNTDSNTGCNNSSQWVLLTMGILGAISTVLSALFMFMNNQAQSEEHSTASSNYEKLHRYIESVLSMPVNIRGDPIEIIKDIRSVYDDVATNSPLLTNDPIPGGMLYNPIVASPPSPENFDVNHTIIEVEHREDTEQTDFANLEKLASMHNDVILPFDIDAEIHKQNTI
jgi:hypothetical protein